jgi:ATP-dependent DNA helicase RecG
LFEGIIGPKIVTNENQQLALNFDGPLALLSVDEIYDKASVELFRLLKEDRRVERKPAGIHVDVLGEYFSMWANTAPDGGITVLGMEDDGGISGCARLSINQVNRLESARIEHCPDSRSESRRVPAVGPNSDPQRSRLFGPLRGFEG